MRRFFGAAVKATRLNRAHTRRLAVEMLEDRRCKSVSPILVGPIDRVPVSGVFEPPPPQAEGSISFNPANGVVTVQGTDNHDDSVKVYINHRAGNGAGNLPDLLTVQLSNINTPQVRAFDPGMVTQIIFLGYSGNDTFDNRSAIGTYVDGGIGNDIILGGIGDDILYGNDGDDYIDGRAGNDTVVGGNGHDAVFGDDGNDYVYGGAGDDKLFGGNGVDRLFGEAGNDRLYGGAATDVLTDSEGTNTKYTDYGPDNTVSASGYQAFDFFDHYLKDADVRSLARLEFKDGVLNRNDMLNLYTQIATDGVFSVIPNIGTVSANELSDLKALVAGTKINFQTDTRFFATKIANGDAANAIIKVRHSEIWPLVAPIA